MQKTLIAMLILGIALISSGCYDNRETDTLATVMAVGIDKGEKYGFKMYTFAVADTGGMSGSDKGDGTSLICFNTEAKSIGEAIGNLEGTISKEPSFSHISAILFSKSAALHGMYEDIDYFEKKISVRPQTMIAVTDINAGEYLSKLKPILESNPEKYFQSIFKNKNSDIRDMSISDFTNAYYTDKEVLAPVISTNPAEEYCEKNSFVIGTVTIYGGAIRE
jgi:hypothetical protein